MTGNVVTAYVHRNVFDRPRFEPEERFCGDQIAFRDHLEVWTSTFSEGRVFHARAFLRTFEDPRKGSVRTVDNGDETIGLPQGSVIHLGKPSRIRVDTIARLERLSASTGPVFFLSERNTQYWGKEPAAVVYLKQETEVEGERYCFSYRADIDVPRLLQVCTSEVAGEEEGVIVFDHSYGT